MAEKFKHEIVTLKNINELQKLKDCHFESIREINEECAKDPELHIKGVIKTAYATFETRKTFTRKLVIKNEVCQDILDTINLFLKGDVAKKCNFLQPNDTIVIKGFTLEKTNSSGHPFRILLDSNKNDVTILAIPHKQKVPSTTMENATVNTKPSETSVKGACGRNSKQSSSRGGGFFVSSFDALSTNSQNSNLNAQSGKESYTKLAELKHGAIKNFYGLVKFCKVSKTRRGEYVAAISLVDESLSSLEESFKCNIFTKSVEHLPLVHSVGDILRLDGVSLVRFNGVTQGTVSSFKSDSFSWLSFNGSYDAPVLPMASSSAKYHMDDDDITRVRELKDLAKTAPRINPSRTLQTISGLDPSTQFVNLACQVLALWKDPALNFLVLQVWDGTTPRYGCDVEVDDHSRWVMDRKISEQAGGMAIPVCLYDEHSTGPAADLNPGDFVMLANVRLKEVDNEENGKPRVECMMHSDCINGRGVYMLKDTGWTDWYLQKLKDSIQNYLDTHPPQSLREEIAEAVSDLRTQQTSCTVTDHPMVPFTTLWDIHNQEKVPNKYKCRVKAISFIPPQTKEFVQLHCSTCKKLASRIGGPSGSNIDDDCDGLGTQHDRDVTPHSCPVCGNPFTRTYLFSLLLADRTDMLIAMVFDDDVKHFFPNLPSPEDFLASEEHQDGLHHSLVSMTQNPECSIDFDSQSLESRPWMECCVMSYHSTPEDTSKIRRSVKYRIFGTTLV
ncbi:predicted protein [Nematostella vectensis]|uniref:Protection of telomeres protein 1 n=1 Tax=Nematostella vectensis TaxID=45351 RepID=A7RNA7_NEMVE|nr:predicted protein [Nematostella vectensis]|eukprot:XP_001639094.1 predicted protein [Nematostella vectensis]